MQQRQRQQRQWRVRRQAVHYPDGQRRWDQTYQLLLRWTQSLAQTREPEQKREQAALAGSSCPPQKTGQKGEEAEYEDR